jgi:hypothetical protein
VISPAELFVLLRLPAPSRRAGLILLAVTLAAWAGAVYQFRHPEL